MGKKISKRHIELGTPIKTLLGIIIPCMIGILVSFILSIFFSYVLSKSPEISKFISIYFIISVLSGAFFCGFSASKLLNFKGLISGLICSFPFLSLVLFVMLLASDGKLSVFSIVFLVFVIVVSVIGGIVSSNMKRRK